MQQIHKIQMYNHYIQERQSFFLMPESKNTTTNPNVARVVSADAVGDHISHCVQLAQFSDTDIGTLCSLCRGRRITNQYATYV